jgi:hypothetical protein
MLELTDVAGRSEKVIARRRPGNKGRRYPADPGRRGTGWLVLFVQSGYLTAKSPSDSAAAFTRKRKRDGTD